MAGGWGQGGQAETKQCLAGWGSHQWCAKGRNAGIRMLHDLILILELKHHPHKERSLRPRLLYPVQYPRTKGKDLEH